MLPVAVEMLMYRTLMDKNLARAFSALGPGLAVVKSNLCAPDPLQLRVFKLHTSLIFTVNKSPKQNMTKNVKSYSRQVCS